ncbi:FAD-linked oxidase C-terminal domain-containing protein, partial [Nocardiopsis tropica]
VGLLKMRGAAREMGPDVVRMHHAVKNALDPRGIFNPGKVFA